MPPHWRDTAQKMSEMGWTYKQIASAINRTPARVGQVLNNVIDKRKRQGKVARQDSELVKLRRVVRRYCRRQAEKTGVPVQQLYIENNVADISKSELWDKRK